MPVGKELVLVGNPSDAMAVDQLPGPADDDDDAEEGLGLLRNLRRGVAGAPVAGVAGVSPDFVDPNSVRFVLLLALVLTRSYPECWLLNLSPFFLLGQIPSVLNPHPGALPAANANANAHRHQPPM